jgi:hypothetical protein
MKLLKGNAAAATSSKQATAQCAVELICLAGKLILIVTTHYTFTGTARKKARRLLG